MARIWNATLAGLVILGYGSGCRDHEPECIRATSTLCLRMRIAGQARGGELGFRFGAPRDASGDGVPDIAAGARFTRLRGSQDGIVGVWSGASSSRLLYWEGNDTGGLFGHSAVLVPDIDGDRLADVVAAAPTGRPPGRPGEHREQVPRGQLLARSPRTGAFLWTLTGQPGEPLGWDIAVTGDHTGDTIADLFVGAPAGPVGRVYLVDGKRGRIVQTYTSPEQHDSFGWYVSPLPDMDGDGREDLVIGAPLARIAAGQQAGAAYVLSSATGRHIHVWRTAVPGAQYGEMTCGLPDIDGDAVPDIAVGAPHTHAQAGAGAELAGVVLVYSGATGAVIHRFAGKQERELYGRMVARAGDVDGDGVEDLAIGAPWYRAGDMDKAGRVELRSGATGAVLDELIGDAPERWLGWHIVPVQGMGGAERRGLVISSVRSQETDLPGAGAVELYLYRR